MAKVTASRTKERIKQTGEVFTPPELVNEMLDKLPQELFTDPTKTFIDPAAGDGNFIIEVLKRKMKNGSTSLQAISTTYAVELMEDNVEDMHKRIVNFVISTDGKAGWSSEHSAYLVHNYVQADSLKVDYDAWKSYDESSADERTTNPPMITDVPPAKKVAAKKVAAKKVAAKKVAAKKKVDTSPPIDNATMLKLMDERIEYMLAQVDKRIAAMLIQIDKRIAPKQTRPQKQNQSKPRPSTSLLDIDEPEKSDEK